MTYKHLLKHTARSLYLSIALMPKDVAKVFTCGYLLCRYADTIADTNIIPTDKRHYFIKRFPNIVKKQNERDIKDLLNNISDSNLKSEVELLKNFRGCLALLNSLNSNDKRSVLNVVYQVCKGMLIDTNYFKRQYNGIISLRDNFQLNTYCKLIGGDPGVFWIKVALNHNIIENNKIQSIMYGKHTGKALQITNILRDLNEDLSNGRCYIPIETLKRYKIFPKDFLNNAKGARTSKAINYWIKWGIRHFEDFEKLMRNIPKKHWRFRLATILPVIWCLDTLFVLAKNKGFTSSAKKLKISKFRIYSTLAIAPVYLISDRILVRCLKNKTKQIEQIIS